MLTRIVSGTVLVIVAAALLCFHLLVDFPYLLIAVLALAAATATFELTKNAKQVNNKVLVWISSVWAGLLFTAFCIRPAVAIYIAVLFVLTVVFCTLYFYGKVSNSEIMAAIAIPVILSFAFFCVYALLERGILYLLLLLNFSSISDCGAYFVGVTLGKHKLCEKISPKKTIEGALGGIAVSMAVTVLLCFCFNITNKLIPLLVMTPVLCIIGMMGDLFASVIKRNADIKDYGKLIPGHGGITDRFDSILLIAPVFVLLLNIF